MPGTAIVIEASNLWARASVHLSLHFLNHWDRDLHRVAIILQTKLEVVPSSQFWRYASMDLKESEKFRSAHLGSVLTMNLASVSKICDSECDVKFYVSDCSIFDPKTQKVVGTSHRKGDLYVLDHFRDIHDTTSSSMYLSSFWLNHSSSAFYLWHSRLGHVTTTFAIFPSDKSGVSRATCRWGYVSRATCRPG
ncbi:hypothetical protein Tco_0561491 [Tanacetum coccineum]